jgi:fatty acid desaturase
MKLRYLSDLRTLFFIAIYWSLFFYQWIVAPQAWYVAVPLFGLTTLFSFITAVITHNTLHCPIFERRWANRAFQVLLTLGYGHPVSAFVPGHNLSHHKYVQGPRDIMRTTKMRYRWNFLNGLLFFPTVSGAIFKGDIRYFKAMYRRNKRWFAQLMFEVVPLVAVTVTLLALDWQKFLFYFYLPHVIGGAAGIVSINLLQHDGCDEDHPYNHSRNFTGKLMNFLCLNNGYHGIHHLQPAAHWSRLPQLHAELIHPFIHPALEQPSMLAYTWRTYFWPGERLRYDGKPVVLPPESPDESWVPAPGDADAADVSFGAVA